MLPAQLFSLLASGSNAGVLVLFAIIGAAAGAYLFVKGFRLLRFKRLILNTPLSRIHSASIGLVEVTGTPAGPYVIKAPVSGDSCYYYRVRAWQWVETDNNKHQWKSVLDESLCVPFFLEDSTGRVLVNPQGAEMDVHRSFSDEIDVAIFRVPGMCPANVRDFLAKRGLVPAEKIKIEENTIPESFPLFVFGTLGENTTANSWSAHEQRDPSLHMSVGALSAALTTGAPPMAGVLAGAARPGAAKSSFGPFDMRPSAAIGRGERHEPFAISHHSQREVVGKLAWQSTACIWGGPVLALICIYFLMSYAQ